MGWPGTYEMPEIIGRIANDRAVPFAGRESVLSIPKTEVRKYTWHARGYSLASQWELTPGPTSGLYDVPEKFLFWRFYVPFTRSGAIVKRAEQSGWIFCHGGPVLFAFRSVKPCAWGKPREHCDVLWSDALKKAKTDASLLDAKPPRLRHTSITGHTLDLTFTPFGTPYKDQHRLDGAPVDYRADPLTGNPWVHQEVNGEVLTLRHGGLVRTYDFKAWKVTGR